MYEKAKQWVHEVGIERRRLKAMSELPGGGLQHGVTASAASPAPMSVSLAPSTAPAPHKAVPVPASRPAPVGERSSFTPTALVSPKSHAPAKAIIAPVPRSPKAVPLPSCATFVVKEILGNDLDKDGEEVFLVWWKGAKKPGPLSDCWEPAESFNPEDLDKFKRSRRYNRSLAPAVARSKKRKVQ